MSPEFPPHELPLRSKLHSDFRFFGRHIGCYWRVQNFLGLWRNFHNGIPYSSRMRGSSRANSTSEMNVPMTVNVLNTRMNPAATYISWSLSALNRIGPEVGRFKTMETM